jgi:bifunctional non-homologous end joining protein LigD
MLGFDVVVGEGLGGAPRQLEAPKEALRRIVPADGGPIRYSRHWVGDGSNVFREACRLGFEGLVSKRRDLPYRAGRSPGWLKSKCLLRQEFAIGGFTLPSGPREGIGSLLVGVHDGGRLRFAGKVGTGFTEASSRDLRRRLEALRVSQSPFARKPPGWLGRNARWVEPRLSAEVTFGEWTQGGHIRHPSFQGLREDKPARDVKRERTEVRGIGISHPSRVGFPGQGYTKLDLARYHDAVAEAEVPHLRGRPLTLVRCPTAIGEGCSFMKHSKVWAPAALRRARIQEKTKLGEYLIADTPEAVIALVQMDVIEIHTWNTRDDDVERPDRVVIDLDPGPEVPWREVVAGAHLLREAMAALGLRSFVKTTGGAGLHLVAPLLRERDWSECLAFARGLAQAVERQRPRTFTTRYAKAGRERKILLDYLRNNRTNTSVAAYSPRARDGAPVSVPLAWEELTARLDPGRFTIETVPRRVLEGDPWREYWKVRQRISAKALRAVGGP